MKKTAIFRKVLKENDLVVMPGAFDAVSAKLIEATGFQSILAGGYACSASHLGEPDLQFMSFSEILDLNRRIARAVNIPVIADADNGYGNAVNTYHVVRRFEEAGVAGLHIEDQVLPKKCGHIEGKKVIHVEEMIQKIRAAVHARTDPDFVIIARTDARAVTGLDDAIERCHAFLAAGADMVAIDAPESMEELKEIGENFRGVFYFNAAMTGKTPFITISQARELGFKIMVYPVELLWASANLMKQMLTEMREKDGFIFMAEKLFQFKSFNEFIGFEKYCNLEQKFTTEASDIVKLLRRE